MDSEKVPPIGIDLGTTCSCVGIYHNGTFKVIANDQGNQTTPSYVSFMEKKRLIGDAAKAQEASNPENTIFNAKRLIGRLYEDWKIQQDLNRWPFKILNQGGKPMISAEYKGYLTLFKPEEISAMILTKLKETAETFLGQKVTDAVITVPAYFNDSQRRATRGAGKIAGLNVQRIINEPTAAALAYGFDKNLQGEKNILIFDIGGGTFDVSVITVNGCHSFNVKSTAGDTHLGGEDFVNKMVTHFVEEFKYKHRRDIASNLRALSKLRTACENAKITLSSSEEASIEIDSLYEGINFYSKISRARFEEICMDLFSSTLKSVERALTDAKLDKGKIHDVVLVGGSTRIPKIQRMLKDFFDGKELNMSFNLEEAVAKGAAIQAVILSKRGDEKIKRVILRDVTPLSLITELSEGKMHEIFQRNSRIPCQRLVFFTTGSDNQLYVDILVYVREPETAKYIEVLGEFRLLELTSYPKLVPRIKVSFNLDADGILSVSAIEETFGKRSSIHIKLLSSFRFKARNEIKKYEKECSSRQERVLARNSLENDSGNRPYLTL